MRTKWLFRMDLALAAVWLLIFVLSGSPWPLLLVAINLALAASRD